jgi:hypothetical protein
MRFVEARMRFILFSLLVLLWAVPLFAGEVVAKERLRLDTRTKNANRLHNGDLESVTAGAFAAWQAYEQGYEVDTEVAHSGRASARCRNATDSERRGISYRIDLNQTAPALIVVECWSKAEGVSEGAAGDYSLYLDLEYADGTPLWGQVAAFEPGTHDWQKRTVTIIPSKPVRSLALHGLLRNRTGTAWFDDFALWTLGADGETAVFDGVPVKRPKEGRQQTDGGRFLLRDVAADSDFIAPAGESEMVSDSRVTTRGRAVSLGLTLTVTRWEQDGVVHFDGTVQDRRGTDRAVTVYFAYPVEAIGWNWYDDQRAARRIEEDVSYQNLTNIGAGANGHASRYPLACVAGAQEAVAVAAPLDVPRLWRFGYDAASRELYAAVDLGLSPETSKFPSRASFSLVLYHPDPAWGFRAALARYYQLFPRCFTKRNTKEGIWMPFSDIEKVKGFEDFGFQFKEGDNNVPFDRAHGIDSFVYVEPMSYWLALPKEVARTKEAAFAYAQQQAAEGREEAKAAVISAEQDARGEWIGDIRDTPWCDGIVYYLNPSPSAGGGKYDVNWRGIDRAFAQNPNLSGVYVDSFEMAADLRNYRREQFRNADTPLVFDRQGRLCQLGIFNSVEFARDLAQRMWGKGLMTFANSTPIQFPWGTAWFDVMGIEMNWSPGGQYRPPSDDELNYFRALAAQRPYLILQNTVFDDFPYESVERYMKRCAAYGIFPSFFSHNASEDPYWQRPNLYDRDRPLFKRYIPVIQRLGAAGWEPVTRARSDDEKVYVERFGKPGEKLFLTVFNDTGARRQTTITLEAGALAPGRERLTLTDVLSGKKWEAPVREGKAAVTLELGDGEVAVLAL